jgi:hypothetical protein
MAPAATLTSVTQAASSLSGSASASGDFVQDVSRMAASIDRRLRMSLTPREYAMVQDLVLATRIMTIARDAADELEESNAA